MEDQRIVKRNLIMFPIGTANRPDFEQVVRKLDEIFFSEDANRIRTKPWS